MPVPRPRGMENTVNHVIVRKTGPDGAAALGGLKRSVGATAPIEQILDSPDVKRHFGASRRDDAYEYDDDDDDIRGSPLVTTTATSPQFQSTSSALPAQTASPQRSGGTPGGQAGSGGISTTTHHLLIAAGSIGATIILVMIILAIHTMRKRGLTFREAVMHGKSRITRRGAPPTPPKTDILDRKPAFDPDYKSARNDNILPPQRAMTIARSGSNSSQRPLMALQRSDSFNNRASERSASPGPVPQGSFLLDSPPGRNNSHRRKPSDTPSSPILPLQNSRGSQSTHNTRSMSEASELRYPDPPHGGSLPALPPPPTFKQFLVNRPSVSARMGPNQMVSRFSWTNSNAPQTPHDASRDTAIQTAGRDSFMTQRSSVPRFRTVDSWVGQQANRLEEQKLREQFRLTQSSTASIPEVPEIPQNVVEESAPKTAPPQYLPPPPNGLPGKVAKHERHDTRTTVDTAPIFRAHPGTEVRFSTLSAVPSEILDMGRKPNVLS